MNNSEVLQQEFNSHIDAYSSSIKLCKLKSMPLRLTDIRNMQDKLKQKLKDGNSFLLELEKMYDEVSLENEQFVEALRKENK